MTDYIDRKALIERLTRNLNACNPGTFSERCYQDAINTVNFFPAVDVTPAVHGEREKLIKICFHEFCNIAGDSPCGCDACPYGNYDTENGECYEEYKKNKLKNLEQAGVTV